MMNHSPDGSNLRQEFRALLHEQSQMIDQLLEKLNNPDASPVELVELIEHIERLDRRKGRPDSSVPGRGEHIPQERGGSVS